LPRRQFAIVTADGTGLGWATMLNDEGELVTLVREPKPDEEAIEEFDQLGNGIIETLTLAQALKVLPKDTYWIFDTNNHSDVSMSLRKHGRKVFGASSVSEQMECDRAHAIDTAQRAGLDSPTMEEFTDLEQGRKYLEANEDIPYVFKPNGTDVSHLTFVPSRSEPEDANAELRFYLDHLTDPVDSFVLQERKSGVEVCFELWIYKGTPILGTCTFENKRKLNHDLGEHGPCAHDIIFTLPMDSKGIEETAAKLYPLMGDDYTGFVDVNVIVGDNQAWFLETGCRFGYNAHPNLFHALAIDGFGATMADYMDGKVDGFADRFRKGFGASVSVRLDHPRGGLPLHLSEKCRRNYYPYDLYRDGDQLLLSGYSHDVGVYTRHAYTIRDAGERCIEDLRAEAVSFPDIGYRDDIAENDYHQSPQRRYDALTAMGWLR